MLSFIKSTTFHEVISKGGNAVLEMTSFNQLTKTCFCSDRCFFTFTVSLPKTYIVALNSGLGKNLRAGQTIASLPANEDTVYTLSAWAQTLCSAATSYVNDHAHLDKTFAICVTDSEGNVLAQYDFDTTTDEWQFGAVSFQTDEELENIKVVLMADCQIYYTRFDDVRLFESDYGYVISDEVTFDTMSSTDSLIIAEDGTIYRTEPCEDCTCAQCTEIKTITYNDIETEVYYNCDCGKENVECTCLGCRQERGSITQSNELYYLPLTQTLSNGTKTLTTAYTYSSNYNYLASASESGVTTYYNYNPDTGNLDEYGTQINSNGEIINPVVYLYNAVGALTQVKQLVTDLSDGENALSLETNYTYADDRITSVSHGGTTYTFDYDHYGNLVNTSVNGNTIISHSYPDHKNVGTVTYANGLVIGYTYDDEGNITSIKHNGIEKYVYEYTDSTLTKSVDYINSLVTYYTDETTTVKFFTLENGTIIDGETIYCYNTDNLTETVFGVTFTHSEEKQSYNSGNDTVDTTSSVSFANSEILLTETVDFFDRTVNENFTLNIDTAVNTTASKIYTYDDTDTTVSNRIVGVENKLADTTVSNYTYTYDPSGNITEVRNNGTLLYKYEYDEAGQIAKDYNFATSTATTFVYDANGNIVSKTPYTNVTSADLSTATAGTPITYTYDTNWTDKLTSYNGQGIVYDEIGNPTSYRGATLTWNGRLLTSYEKGADRFEYTYDENGLRTSKKHFDNGIYNLTYHYLWQNSRLYGAKVTFADEKEPLVLNYLYDNDEAIGVYLYDTVLLYVKNIQGDIVSVVNTEDNEIVLQYYYDAWGNISYESSDSIAGAIVSALVLAATNFSYRGYFCDYETGLYYLQSRYYDPEVGRFINLDDTAVAISGTSNVLGSNLFAYCMNNPTNHTDPYGFAAILIGTVMSSYLMYFVASVFAIAICTSIMSTYNSSFGFRNSWSQVANIFASMAYTLNAKITQASTSVWNWTKKRVSTTASAAKAAISVAIADAKVRTKVKKDGKQQYWEANFGNKCIVLGSPISRKQAVARMKNGKNVFTTTKSKAKSVATEASYFKKPVGPEIDSGKSNTPGYYYHYHLNGRKHKNHIWYLYS